MPYFIITTPVLPASPLSYMLWPIPSPPSGCTGTPKNHICYIVSADYGTGHPIIDSFILGQIITALNTNTDNLWVALKN